MSAIGFNYKSKADDIATKHLKVAITKMRISLTEVCRKTMSDVPLVRKNEIYNGIFYNPQSYYEIHDDIESKSKKITFLDDNDEMVKNAEKLVIRIIDKLRTGNSAASKELDELLKNNNLRIRISPVPEIDAGCEYIPPQSSEKGTINLGLCSGCFADGVTEDELAVTIGHEFGHALLEEKMGGNTNIPHIECFEIENFCDTFGARLAQASGYNIQARNDYLSKTKLKGNAVHPGWEHRKKTNSVFPANDKKYQSLDKGIVDKFNRYNKELVMQAYIKKISNQKV